MAAESAAHAVQDNSATSIDDIDGNMVAIADELKERLSLSPNEGLRRGKVKWYNVTKGWGFITPDDGGNDVFVHQSVIKMGGFRSLGENEEVEFECKCSEKGLEATLVRGTNGNLKGSAFRPKVKKRLYRKIRCYNCGEFANHIALKCSLGPMPKRCHNCKSNDHLVVDCPHPKTEKRSSTATTQETESQSETESVEQANQ